MSRFSREGNHHNITVLLLIPLLLFGALAGTAAVSVADRFAPGDVDGNGSIESSDARLALRASVQLEHYSEESPSFLAADVDGNGTIEAADARMILRASVSLEELSSQWHSARAMSIYEPEQEIWSVWDDMPDNSVYTGSPAGFSGSVSADIDWDSASSCQVLKLSGMVYITCPEAELFIIGRLAPDGSEQDWMVSMPQASQPAVQHVPVVLSDTNCYISSTGDETDMTDVIQRMLTDHLYCRLGPGDYHVTGLRIPENGMLEGSGPSTRLILSPSVKEGAAVRMSTRSCVRDLSLAGALNTIKPTKTVGSRHGVLFAGKASSDGDVPYHATIENISVTDFTGGGITCSDTGYNVDAGINVSDCWISNCGAGINIRFFSEYHRFTNVSSTRCYYGCVDNGGNNMFYNCSFSGNTVGLLMDNSKDQSKNSSHGSFTGCVFNHSDNNAGYAMKIIGMKNGQMFTGCQVFYGKTLIKDSRGIQFIGSNMGKETGIEITNSTSILYSNCTMASVDATPVTIDKNCRSVVFTNCFCYDGTEITAGPA